MKLRIESLVLVGSARGAVEILSKAYSHLIADTLDSDREARGFVAFPAPRFDPSRLPYPTEIRRHQGLVDERQDFVRIALSARLRCRGTDHHSIRDHGVTCERRHPYRDQGNKHTALRSLPHSSGPHFVH
jgi:hypothetical protein